MHDLIGFMDMTSGIAENGNLFTKDRFGNKNEALSLNYANTYLASGYYFTTTAFSISLWIRPIYSQFGFSTDNVIDFGNGNNNGINVYSDDIIFNLLVPDLKPVFQVYYSSTCVINAQSSIGLVNGHWHHLTATYDGLTASIYINGTLTGSVKQAYSLPLITRMSNNFGVNNLNYRQTSALLDDIRFYNVSLTKNQIVNIMKIENAYNKRKYSDTFHFI